MSHIESDLKVSGKTLERWIKQLKTENKIGFKEVKKLGDILYPIDS